MVKDNQHHWDGESASFSEPRRWDRRSAYYQLREMALAVGADSLKDRYRTATTVNKSTKRLRRPID